MKLTLQSPPPYLPWIHSTEKSPWNQQPSSDEAKWTWPTLLQTWRWDVPVPTTGDAVWNPAAASPGPADPLTWDLPGVETPTLWGWHLAVLAVVFLNLTAFLWWQVIPGPSCKPSCHLPYMLQSAVLLLPFRNSLSPTAYVTAPSSHLTRCHLSFPWREATVVFVSHSCGFKRPALGKKQLYSCCSYSRDSGWEVWEAENL